MPQTIKEKQTIGGKGNQAKPGLSRRLEHFQVRCALWLANRTGHYSYRKWILLLACFVLLTGGYSGYVLVEGLTGGKGSSLSLSKITRPEHATESGITDRATITHQQYQQIVALRHYLDSLSRDPQGRAEYGRIIEQQPGLTDSLKIIEEYYKRQLINKDSSDGAAPKQSSGR